MVKTKIEWATESWNPITGCTPVSEGCENCYAKRLAEERLKRLPKYRNGFKPTFHPEEIDAPCSRKKPRKIFVCSMGDLFHSDIPQSSIATIFNTMCNCSQHIFMVLTKRPEQMLQIFHNWSTEGWDIRAHNHIWLGVTAENQKRADERIPILLQIPAAVRFVSVEPMLSEIRIHKYMYRKEIKKLHPKPGLIPGIDWVVAGGESGPRARPMHPTWALSLRDQCQAAGVPFFFKQWGEWAPFIYKSQTGESVLKLTVDSKKEIIMKHDNTAVNMRKVGKKKAGRLLDGREWSEYPRKTITPTKRVFFDINLAIDAGIKEHPQTKMKQLGIKYYACQAQSLFDGWEFWVDSEVVLPSYIRKLQYIPPPEQ